MDVEGPEFNAGKLLTCATLLVLRRAVRLKVWFAESREGFLFAFRCFSLSLLDFPRGSESRHLEFRTHRPFLHCSSALEARRRTGHQHPAKGIPTQR